MKYRLIQNVEGKWLNTELTDENLHAALEVRGFEFIGLQTGNHLRKELQGEPMFSGLIGPMWDGDAVRYEDQAAYDRLSI